MDVGSVVVVAVPPPRVAVVVVVLEGVVAPAASCWACLMSLSMAWISFPYVEKSRLFNAALALSKCFWASAKRASMVWVAPGVMVVGGVVVVGPVDGGGVVPGAGVVVQKLDPNGSLHSASLSEPSLLW